MFPAQTPADASHAPANAAGTISTPVTTTERTGESFPGIEDLPHARVVNGKKCNHPKQDAIIRTMRRLQRQLRNWTRMEAKDRQNPRRTCRCQFCHDVRTVDTMTQMLTSLLDNHLFVIDADVD